MTVRYDEEAMFPSISTLFSRDLCLDEGTYQRFTNRLAEGSISRDENPTSHFGVFFLPYNPKTKTVFITHHKKAGTWIPPGGHVDLGEHPSETFVREIGEELGADTSKIVPPDPFFFSIFELTNPNRICKIHFDIWYLFKTDGVDFHVDPSEFHETRWVSFPEARKLVTETDVFQAFDRVERM